MRKGENIFKRKDGRWEARYIKSYEPSGEAKYGFCYGRTYKEAKEKTIRISATLQRLRDTERGTENKDESRTRIVVSTPKTETSVRTIPLTDYAIGLCKRFALENPLAYVLTGTEDCMEPRVLQYRIKKYTKSCDLDGVHAHTLRYTFATRC